VVFGHDGGMGTSTLDIDVGAPANFTRTERIWSATKVGSIGANVLMNLDDAAGGGTPLNGTATESYYTLLYRTGSSGIFFPVANGASVNNGIVTFNGVTMQNGQYTIGVGDSEYDGVGILSAAIKNIDVFPNPSNGEFYLDLGGLPHGVATMEVFTSNGQVILSEKLNSNRRILDLTDFDTGLYQLRITAESEVFGQRLVVR